MINKIRQICYSFGAVATALSYQAFSTYILFFYVDKLRLDAKLAAVAMLIYGVWNAVNDPIAGFISDSTKTSWGRRIPYILFGSIPFGLVYFLLWVPPFTSNNMAALFWYFLIFICIFDALYTVVVINWASLFPEMYRGLRERAEVNSYRQAFGMAGLIIGIALPPLLYTSIGWAKMGAIFGAIITLAFIISLAGSREKPKAASKNPLPFFKAFSETFKNIPFVMFVTSNLLIQYAFTMVLAMIPFYAKYVLQIKARETSLVLLSALIFAAAMMFVWKIICVRYGAKMSYLISIMIFMVALIPLLVISGFNAAVAFAALLGIGLAGIILISDVLISDVIDHDEEITGLRREGIYFGMNAFVCRFAIALEAASIGTVFTMTKYNPVIFTQTKEYLTGLRFLVAGLPIIALAAAFIIMLFYPLSKKTG